MVVRFRSRTWLRAILLALLAAAVPRQAVADDAAGAKRAYQRGYEALQGGEFAEALAHYEESYRLEPRPRTLFNMGVCQEGLGQGVAAWKSYHEFIDRAEPRDREFVARAEERIAVLRRRLAGSVRITSDPRGAAVRLSGQRRIRGRTPAVVQLPPGRHELVVSLGDAPAVRRVVEIEPEERVSVDIELDLLSEVVVHARPADAVIEPANGEPARGTYRGRLPAGTHELTVSRPGYRDQRLTIEARPGKSEVHHVMLQPEEGAGELIVTGPSGASLSIDGEVADPALGDATRVPAGEHRVRVERTGHHPWVDTVHLAPGERLSVDVELPRRWPAWLVWGGAGVGAAAIASGSVLGVGALRDVASDMPDRRDRGKRRALVADGLFVVGVAALVTSWYLSRGSSSATIHRSRGGAR